MGPMAEEFRSRFGLGKSDRHITGIDADGVALAAIQGLAQRLREKEERIDELEDRLSALEVQVEAASQPAED